MDYEAAPFAPAERDRLVFFYWKIQGFTEDFGGKACVVVDELGVGVEALA